MTLHEKMIKLKGESVCRGDMFDWMDEGVILILSDTNAYAVFKDEIDNQLNNRYNKGWDINIHKPSLISKYLGNRLKTCWEDR